MSKDNKELFNLEDDSEQNDLNHHEVNGNNNDVKATETQDDNWIDELRQALEKGCDLGSIRTIGKCRPLTDDLRLRVWKVRN